MGVTHKSKIENIPLRDICHFTSSGGTPNRNNYNNFCDSGEGHLWVKSKELIDRPISKKEENITDKALKKSAAKYYNIGTILLAMYGANVGRLGWLKQRATVNQAICGIVIDDKK